EAVAAIEKHVPDLVVLDIVMPVMGGYAVIHHIRFSQKLPTLPILVVSSNEEIPSDVRDATGVDFFPKSGSAKLLLQRIEKFFLKIETPKPSLGLRDQFEALQKFENKMTNREMQMLEQHIRDVLNRNKNTIGPSRPGDLEF